MTIPAYKQNFKFQHKPRAGKAPEGEAIRPKHVKVQICPSAVDQRFKADPGHVGLFSKLGPGRYITEES